MGHKFDEIRKEHIEKAAKDINAQGVDKNNDWNEYYVEVGDGLYPFKSLVLTAYHYTGSQKTDFEFKSNESNRNKIRDLGYNIHYIQGGIKYSEL